jgi:hypothetical protein
MRPDHGGIGFPAPASTSTFRPGPAVSLRPPSTTSLRLRRHPPTSFAPPLEYYDLRPALCVPSNLATARRPESASLGVSSLIAAPAGSVHSCAGSHPHADVPSSAFRTPSTACSATSLAGLFRPATTSRVCPPGVCSSPRSRTGLLRPSHALLPLDEPACGLTRASETRPRLQGLAPRDECGVERGCLEPRPIRAPPGLPDPPPGTHSPHREKAFALPPPTTFIAMSPPRRVLGVSPVRGTVCLVTRPPTRTRFLTSAPSLLSQEGL